MGLLNNSNAIESGGYNIDRSLRFRRSASAYLSRTLGSNSTSQTTMTWSGWIKRGALNSAGRQVIFYEGNAGATGGFILLEWYNDSLRLLLDGGATYNLTTSAVYRDPSAWYHIVLAIDTTQATAANRVKLYVNGSQITAFSTASYPTLNYTINNAATNLNQLGNLASLFFDGYLAEVNFIDGQALSPTSFGETSTETGAWIPKKFGGTYGTNGFYLPFSDNTSATTLAYDKSGNGNNWTPNNISTTAGATYDSMTDVPTLTSATAANYCVLNPLFASQASISSATAGAVPTLSNGNQTVTAGTSSVQTSAIGTIGVTTGKWYCEYIATAVNSTNDLFGFIQTFNGSNAFNGYRSNGTIYNQGATTTGFATWTVGDVIGMALDCDAGTLGCYKNNTLISTVTITGGVTAPMFPLVWFRDASGAGSINFGQRPFSYTPPTGFKALNTFNLPDPVIKKPNQYMDATLYTGTGASNAIVNAAGFQPDLVWLKNRNYGAGTNHVLVDSVRGTSGGLASNLTNAEFSTTGNFSSINSNGFTVAGTAHDYNFSTDTFVGWQWKESATSGFDIVTYTGNGANRTVAHSLGVAPSMMILKDRTTSGTSWQTYHKSLGATDAIMLNSTGATFASSVYWNNTAPTSSVFTVGTSSFANINADNYVAYLFAEIAGFSKFGSYTGNGSADGPFVYLGFRPKLIMWKNTSVASDWVIYDTSRSVNNVCSGALFPDTSGAEASNGDYGTFCDILSNGFKNRSASTAGNNSGNTIIYAAFAENPFKYSLAR